MTIFTDCLGAIQTSRPVFLLVFDRRRSLVQNLCACQVSTMDIGAYRNRLQACRIRSFWPGGGMSYDAQRPFGHGMASD